MTIHHLNILRSTISEVSESPSEGVMSVEYEAEIFFPTDFFSENEEYGVECYHVKDDPF